MPNSGGTYSDHWAVEW